MPTNRVRSGLAMSFCLLLAADAAWSQVVRVKGQNGRVAGLSVSVIDQTPNGGGKDVEIAVDMTTIRTEFTGDYGMGLRGGQRITEAFTESEFTSQRDGFGGLGDADLTSSFRASDSVGRSFTNFVVFSTLNDARAGFSGFYSGNALTFSHTNQSYIEGELPAIDYGDGGTPLYVTSLSPFGSPTTSTDSQVPGRQRITSRWRGTFVHTYADLGSYTVTAASRCCPFTRRGDDDDDTVTRGIFEVSPGYVVPPNSPSQLGFSYTFMNRLVFESYNSDTPTINLRGTPLGTFTEGNQATGTGSQLFNLAQVTNTAQVESGVGSAFAIEIPSAGTYGLALLSLLLAAGGVLVLRR